MIEFILAVLNYELMSENFFLGVFAFFAFVFAMASINTVELLSFVRQKISLSEGLLCSRGNPEEIYIPESPYPAKAGSATWRVARRFRVAPLILSPATI